MIVEHILIKARAIQQLTTYPTMRRNFAKLKSNLKSHQFIFSNKKKQIFHEQAMHLQGKSNSSNTVDYSHSFPLRISLAWYHFSCFESTSVYFCQKLPKQTLSLYVSVRKSFEVFQPSTKREKRQDKQLRTVILLMRLAREERQRRNRCFT